MYDSLQGIMFCCHRGTPQTLWHLHKMWQKHLNGTFNMKGPCPVNWSTADRKTDIDLCSEKMLSGKFLEPQESQSSPMIQSLIVPNYRNYFSAVPFDVFVPLSKHLRIKEAAKNEQFLCNWLMTFWHLGLWYTLVLFSLSAMLVNENTIFL